MLSTYLRGRSRRNHPKAKANTDARHRRQRWTQLALEPLEDRIVPSSNPSVIAQNVAIQMNHYQSELTGLLNGAAALPLVGQQLAQLSNFTNIFQTQA